MITEFRCLLALLCSLLLLSCGGDEPTAPLVVIGIDGAEWSVIEEMMEDGELPNFRRFREDHAWARLINPGPTTSPVVWTSYATGHFARDHGVLDHTIPYDDSTARRPVTSEQRTVPALWTIASSEGRRSAVVGWFVTHPVETIEGVMVSPRAPQRVPGSVWPEQALDAAEESLLQLREPEVRQAMRDRFFGFSYQPGQEDDPTSPVRESAQIVRQRNLDHRIYKDEYLLRATRELMHGDFDLYFSYFRLVDFMSHSLWRYHDGSDFDQPAAPDLQAHFGQSVAESYRYMDEILGEHLDYWGGRANIVVLSDHGFGSATGAFRGQQTALSGNHRSVGIFMAAGPDIAPGEIPFMTALEVTPALAALADLPVSDRWPGQVPLDLFREGYFEDQPLRTIPDFNHLSVELAKSDLDAGAESQNLDSLKGLGYVGEGADLSLSAGEDSGFWNASDRLIARSLTQEVVHHLLHGDTVSANGVYQDLTANRPDLAELLEHSVQFKCGYLADLLEDKDGAIERCAKFFR